MNRLGSKRDEMDRELAIVTFVLRDIVWDKCETDELKWRNKVTDLENVLHHIQQRRYGAPINGH